MQPPSILIFAGTTEGRALFEALEHAGVPAALSVATEYGKELTEGRAGLGQVRAGRLTQAEMAALMRREGYAIVVDATHPYAVEVTKNIQSACRETGAEYYRLLREQDDSSAGAEMISCANLQEAVTFLSSCKGNILSTVGSKELSLLTQLPHFEERVYARILPLPQAVASCSEMGFRGNHLICMQGPFSCEMNLAMLRQYGCRYLLTKDSGTAGGFAEKCRAAKMAGAKVIVVERPAEKGYSYRQMISLLEERLHISLGQKSRHTHFPLFVPTSGNTALLVGGGPIASRRAATLCRFCWKVRVVSPSATETIKDLEQKGVLAWAQKLFDPSDLKGASLVVAATDHREINHLVAEEAKKRNIPVSVADCREEGTFYFPAIAEQGKIVAGICGDGTDHSAVAQAAQAVREVLEQ